MNKETVQKLGKNDWLLVRYSSFYCRYFVLFYGKNIKRWEEYAKYNDLKITPPVMEHEKYNIYRSDILS